MIRRGREKILLKKEWFEDAFVLLDPDDLKELWGQVMNYFFSEDEYEESDNEEVNEILESIIPIIEKESESKIKEDTVMGRPRLANEEEVWRLAQYMTSKQIMQELNIKPSTLYINEGWEQRKNPFYLEERASGKWKNKSEC